MTTHRALGALVVLGLFLPACHAVISLDASPPPAAVAYRPASSAAAPSAAAITEIAAEGMVDVEVTVGAAPSIEVACDPAVLPKIHIESQGTRLRIWNDAVISIGRPTRCVALIGSPRLVSFEATGSGDGHIHGPASELSRVTATGSGNVVIDDLGGPSVQLAATGSGDVTAKGLHAHALAITADGSGNVHAAGTSERVEITCSGSGDVDTRGLGAGEATAHASGSGNVELTASQRADVVASGSGDIRVHGRPAQRTANQNGSGEISFD